MKKLMIMAMVIMPVIAHGATMCSKNDTITIALDPAIKGNTYNYNQASSTWRTSFSYGTIRGISACLSSNYGQSRGGYVADLHDNNELVVGGERNGEYCWCKMTHPVASLWVFRLMINSAANCAEGCASGCAFYVNDYSDMRSGLFGSVGQ